MKWKDSGGQIIQSKAKLYSIGASVEWVLVTGPIEDAFCKLELDSSMLSDNGMTAWFPGNI